MPASLTPRQRAALKARAHALEPYVHVGQAGVSSAVVNETDRALTAHELIKVRVGSGDRVERATLLTELCNRTDATLVQSVGRIAIIYRPRPDDGETS